MEAQLKTQVQSQELANKITEDAMNTMLAKIPDFKANKPSGRVMDAYFKASCEKFGTTFGSYKSFCKRANDVVAADEFNPYEI